jgi:hypothetical protein
MAVKFNNKNIQIAVAKAVEAASLPIARSVAKDKFNTELNNLIREIERDPVSQEIMGGNDITNSKFIKGKGTRKYGANLFSFLGFIEGSNPIGSLINYLRKSSRINTFNTKLINNKYTFKIDVPTEGDVKGNFPHDDDFLGGRSWITSIERGLTSATNYIRKLGFGRSGGGTQIDASTGKIFVPKRDFFSEKYKKFINRLNGRE